MQKSTHQKHNGSEIIGVLPATFPEKKRKRIYIYINVYIFEKIYDQLLIRKRRDRNIQISWQMSKSERKWERKRERESERMRKSEGKIYKK